MQESTTTGKPVKLNAANNKTLEYGIDRLTLVNTGLTNEDIDKLYRTLFVNTAGLFHQINEVIQKQSNNMRL